MKRLKSQTLLIIFIIAIISILSPGHGDEDLIETTCKKTPNYNLCVQTLKSDPSSLNADIKGLALIMVKVMKTKVEAISDKIEQLLKRGHLDPTQEKALRSCEERIKIELETIFGSIEQGIELGNPKFAEEGAISIGIEAKNCEENFPNGTSPLTKENKDLRDLTDVAVAIIRILL